MDFCKDGELIGYQRTYETVNPNKEGKGDGLSCLALVLCDTLVLQMCFNLSVNLIITVDISLIRVQTKKPTTLNRST